MDLLEKVKQELSNLAFYATSKLVHSRAEVSNDIPFVCQFAHPSSSEFFLKEKQDLETDPFWKLFGAENPALYAEWSVTACGMASTAMALHYFKNDTPSLFSLCTSAYSADLYERDMNGDLSGMKYYEYPTWIKQFGVQANVVTRLSLAGIQYALGRGGVVVASVNPNIRGYETAPQTQIGGHLVLVTGYSKESKTITINNPSGFTSIGTQKNHELSFTEFSNFFAGRGIILSVT